MTGGLRNVAWLVLGGPLALPLAAAVTSAPPADDAAVVHVLNRLGYGPRPGDVERVGRVGLDVWIDQQLHPEGIPDPAADAAVAALRTTRLSSRELMAGYELPKAARREAQRMRSEMESSASEGEMKRARRELLAKYRSQMDGTPKQVIDELQEAKLIRAVGSERQLDEVLVDFWMNHFNVYAQKGEDRFLVGAYERETIRPHAFGRFEDLLKATAESPAMLFYLDNWLSTGPNPEATRRGRFGRARLPGPDAKGAQRRRGLNENYARELMELHTLGVDGGYTQKDVTEVARCFTGWTIRGLRDGRPEFAFDERRHDAGDKIVLGHVVKSAGRREGEEVLHLLATQPATARFVATKLARRFVADAPPPALVDRAARRFLETDGDIREVVRAIVTSPEMRAPETRNVKVKTPLEFVASAVRAAGGSVQDASELARRVAAMGMPLYLQQPPTGYKDTAEAWVSTNGLLARLNFSLDLAAGRIPGVTVPPPTADPSRLAAQLVPAGLSESRARRSRRKAPPSPCASPACSWARPNSRGSSRCPPAACS